jgi:hypothetical protein
MSASRVIPYPEFGRASFWPATFSCGESIMLPGSFGVFETFRILIPGYFAAVCGTWYLVLYFPRTASYVQSTQLATITFVALGLAAGLVLYLSRLPRDSEEYSRRQPSVYIQDRAKQLGKPIDLKEAMEVYFYLLNNYFSDSMRERIFYYGNIYRVCQKISLISVSFLVLSIGTQISLCVLGSELSRSAGAFIFDAVLLILFLLLRVRAEKHAIEILNGQVQWLRMRDVLLVSLLQSANDPNAKP